MIAPTLDDLAAAFRACTLPKSEWTHVLLIADFLAAFEPAVDLEARVAALIAGPLGERSALFSLWSRDHLMSERARAEWVPPDLAPLAVPPAILAAIRR